MFSSISTIVALVGQNALVVLLIKAHHSFGSRDQKLRVVLLPPYTIEVKVKPRSRRVEQEDGLQLVSTPVSIQCTE